MTIAPATAKIIIREARKEFNRMQDIVANWEAEAKECRKNGFRPKYCVHGTYQWTDYDNICGGCENGDFPQDRTYMDVLKDTLKEYHWSMDKFEKAQPHLFKALEELRLAGLEEMTTKVLLDAIDVKLGRFAV